MLGRVASSGSPIRAEDDADTAHGETLIYPGYHRMVMSSVSTRLWRALESRSADAFLVAGVLLLASPTHVGLELFAEVHLPPWLVALFVLPGLLATLVGLAGRYPETADRAPRVALAGGVATALTGLTLVVLLGWILGASLLNAVVGAAVDLPPDAAFVVLPVLLTLAFVLFGAASLRSAALPRRVGFLLLSFALPWVVSLAGTAVYGSSFPPWLTIAIYGPVPFVMLATGYTLRTATGAVGREDTAVDPTPG